MEDSDWLVFGRDFTLRTINMEMVLFRIFSLSQEIRFDRNTKSIEKAVFYFFMATVQ